MTLLRTLSATLALTFSALLTPSFAQAEEIACTGINLMQKMRDEEPATAAAIDKAATALPYGKGLLWKITKPGTEPSYLFGTIHMSDLRLVILPPKARKAFDASTTLALEITEILDPQKLAGKAFGLLKYTTYLDGTSLNDKLTDQQKAPVKARLADQAGLPWNVAQKLRPWVVMGSIAVPACEMARKRAGEPFLDMALGLEARQKGKTIAALETLEGQMQVMAGLPEDMMIKAMVDTANMGSQMDDVVETMIDLYTKGEIGTIWAMMRHLGPDGMKPTADTAGYAEFQRVVVDQRNISMADASTGLIDKGGAFIAVGALHLPGEQGLLNILVQRGYTVSAP